MSNKDDLLRAVAEFIVADGFEAGEAAKARIREILGKDETRPPIQKDVDLEAVVRRALLELGVHANILGYKYLVFALCMTVKDPSATTGITKKIYPAVAKKFGTTPERAERSIRHGVEAVFERGNYECIWQYFGNSIDPTKGKATNAEFIACVADAIRQKM